APPVQASAPAAPRPPDWPLPRLLVPYVAEAEAARGWRTFVPGVRSLALGTGPGCSDRLRLFHLRPGRSLARHDHAGEEWTLVLTGAFSLGGDRFGAGDLAAARPGMAHAPRVEGAADCVCLVMEEGPMRFTGPFGGVFGMMAR
ncbi:MAG: cupin domain-containing protein, partial [Alphaproteobacteria bacterium]|nr:cupin domain-containing protein [Alphaproteobacteria bacterium]